MYAVNSLPVIDTSRSATGCCSLINPSEWAGLELTFSDKPFVVVTTRSFMHIPLNMNTVMRQTQAAIKEAGADAEEFLVLSHERSPWHADHYFAVSEDVPGHKMERLTGTFLTKVFEGPYKDARLWYKDLISYVKNRGKQPLKTYFFYTTCPNCSKVYGKNYVIGFAQIA